MSNAPGFQPRGVVVLDHQSAPTSLPVTYTRDNSAWVPYLKEAPLGVTIRRGKLPTDSFTIIPNAYLRDQRLPWDTRGLLAWLMSHSEAFKVTEEGMISAGAMRRDGVRRMVRELEATGYLRRDKAFVPGKGTTVDYVLLDPDDGQAVTSDDGEPVVSPDQGKQDIPAGQPYDGESVARSFIEDQEKTNTKTSSSSRGTRLPEDFEPDDKMRTWYAAEGLERAGLNGRLEHQKFMNYWLSKPGAAGRKADWRRTWMNWMLNAAERLPQRPGNTLAPTSGAPYRPSTTDQKVAQTLELGRRLQAMEESK